MEQMNNKELLTNFIEYAKSRHIFPILHSDIEPLVDDYLSEQLLQQTQCTTLREKLAEMQGFLQKPEHEFESLSQEMENVQNKIAIYRVMKMIDALLPVA